MILYYALTTYHIQCCVLHRLTKKPNERAVLLLSDIHKNSVAFLSRYRESGIFDEVFLLKESNVNSSARQNEAKHRSKRFILNSACRKKKAADIDITENVKREFDREGITVPFNQLDVHIKNGD